MGEIGHATIIVTAGWQLAKAVVVPDPCNAPLPLDVESGAVDSHKYG